MDAQELRARELMDELTALDAAVADLDSEVAAAVRAAADAFLMPVRIQIVGRAGVGRTSVAQVVGELGPVLAAGRYGYPNPVQRVVAVSETGAVDVPGEQQPEVDADVVVYVLVDPPREADRVMLAGMESVVAVLNKADTLEDPQARAQACADETGVWTVPLNADSRDGARSDSAYLQQTLTSMVEQVIARRAGELLDVVQVQAARSSVARDLLETFLLSDGAVSLAARVSRGDLADLAAAAPPVPDTADQALRSARWWQARLAEVPEDQVQRQRSIENQQRECLRVWARQSGAVGSAPAGHGA